RAAEIGVALGLVTLVRFGHRVPRRLALVFAAGVVAVTTLVVAASASEHGIAHKLVGENRPHYWGVAWNEWERNRTLGSGAGTFDRYWLHYRTVSSFARDAHSLYL